MIERRSKRTRNTTGFNFYFVVDRMLAPRVLTILQVILLNATLKRRTGTRLDVYISYLGNVILSRRVYKY